MITNRYIPATVLLAMLAPASHAAIINVGDHILQPGLITPIQIHIQREASDPNVLGLNMAVLVSEINGQGPTIDSVDVVTDTIFAQSNEGNQNQGSAERFAFVGTTTSPGTSVAIPSEGLLATITIDTSSAPPGTYNLVLSSVLGAVTELLDTTVTPVPLTVNDGSITVAVPEPTTAGGLLIALSLLLLVRQSRP